MQRGDTEDKGLFPHVTGTGSASYSSMLVLFDAGSGDSFESPHAEERGFASLANRGAIAYYMAEGRTAAQIADLLRESAVLHRSKSKPFAMRLLVSNDSLDGRWAWDATSDRLYQTVYRDGITLDEAREAAALRTAFGATGRLAPDEAIDPRIALMLDADSDLILWTEGEDAGDSTGDGYIVEYDLSGLPASSDAGFLAPSYRISLEEREYSFTTSEMALYVEVSDSKPFPPLTGKRRVVRFREEVPDLKIDEAAIFLPRWAVSLRKSVNPVVGVDGNDITITYRKVGEQTELRRLTERGRYVALLHAKGQVVESNEFEVFDAPSFVGGSAPDPDNAFVNVQGASEELYQTVAIAGMTSDISFDESQIEQIFPGSTLQHTDSDFWVLFLEDPGATLGEISRGLRKAKLTLEDGATSAELRVLVEQRALGDLAFDRETGHLYERDFSDMDFLGAYARARELTIAGKSGYLHTITSERENEVRSHLESGWSAGTRLEFNQGENDGALYRTFADPLQTRTDGFYWSAGPEAGERFYQGMTQGDGGPIKGAYSRFPASSSSNLANPVLVIKANGGWEDVATGAASYRPVIEYGDTTDGEGPLSAESGSGDGWFLTTAYVGTPRGTHHYEVRDGAIAYLSDDGGVANENPPLISLFVGHLNRPEGETPSPEGAIVDMKDMPASMPQPEVTYARTDGDELGTRPPTEAGAYRASITVEGVTLSKEFIIGDPGEIDFGAFDVERATFPQARVPRTGIFNTLELVFGRGPALGASFELPQSEEYAMSGSGTKYVIRFAHPRTAEELEGFLRTISFVSMMWADGENRVEAKALFVPSYLGSKGISYRTEGNRVYTAFTGKADFLGTLSLVADNRFQNEMSYLATPLSASENGLVHEATRGEAFLGGGRYSFTPLANPWFVDPNSLGEGAGGFVWLNGPMRGTEISGGADASDLGSAYANWAAGEPAGSPGDGALAALLKGTDATWKSGRDFASVSGFVTETREAILSGSAQVAALPLRLEAEGERTIVLRAHVDGSKLSESSITEDQKAAGYAAVIVPLTDFRGRAEELPIPVHDGITSIGISGASVTEEYLDEQGQSVNGAYERAKRLVVTVTVPGLEAQRIEVSIDPSTEPERIELGEFDRETMGFPNATGTNRFYRYDIVSLRSTSDLVVRPADPDRVSEVMPGYHSVSMRLKEPLSAQGVAEFIRTLDFTGTDLSRGARIDVSLTRIDGLPRSMNVEGAGTALLNPATGHYYVMVKLLNPGNGDKPSDSSLLPKWFAEWQRRFVEEAHRFSVLGNPGYLATVASENENQFINESVSNRQSAFLGGARFEGMDRRTDGLGFTRFKEEFANAWYWSDGPEAGRMFYSYATGAHGAVQGVYENFGSGEPNDSASSGEVLVQKRENGSWNDVNVIWMDNIVEFGSYPLGIDADGVSYWRAIESSSIVGGDMHGGAFAFKADQERGAIKLVCSGSDACFYNSSEHLAQLKVAPRVEPTAGSEPASFELSFDLYPPTLEERPSISYAPLSDPQQALDGPPSEPGRYRATLTWGDAEVYRDFELLPQATELMFRGYDPLERDFRAAAPAGDGLQTYDNVLIRLTSSLPAGSEAVGRVRDLTLPVEGVSYPVRQDDFAVARFSTKKTLPQIAEFLNSIDFSPVVKPGARVRIEAKVNVADVPDNLRYLPENGHFYFGNAEKKSWGDHYRQARALKLYGVSGYLATSTSAAENALLVEAHRALEAQSAIAWLGATSDTMSGRDGAYYNDLSSTTFEDAHEDVGGATVHGYRWANGPEIGRIAPKENGTALFSDWPVVSADTNPQPDAWGQGGFALGLWRGKWDDGGRSSAAAAIFEFGDETDAFSHDPQVGAATTSDMHYAASEVSIGEPVYSVEGNELVVTYPGLEGGASGLVADRFTYALDASALTHHSEEGSVGELAIRNGFPSIAEQPVVSYAIVAGAGLGATQPTEPGSYEAVATVDGGKRIASPFQILAGSADELTLGEVDDRHAFSRASGTENRAYQAFFLEFALSDADAAQAFANAAPATFGGVGALVRVERDAVAGVTRWVYATPLGRTAKQVAEAIGSHPFADFAKASTATSVRLALFSSLPTDASAHAPLSAAGVLPVQRHVWKLERPDGTERSALVRCEGTPLPCVDSDMRFEIREGGTLERELLAATRLTDLFLANGSPADLSAYSGSAKLTGPDGRELDPATPVSELGDGVYGLQLTLTYQGVEFTLSQRYELVARDRISLGDFDVAHSSFSQASASFAGVVDFDSVLLTFSPALPEGLGISLASGLEKVESESGADRLLVRPSGTGTGYYDAEGALDFAAVMRGITFSNLILLGNRVTVNAYPVKYLGESLRTLSGTEQPFSLEGIRGVVPMGSLIPETLFLSGGSFGRPMAAASHAADRAMLGVLHEKGIERAFIGVAWIEGRGLVRLADDVVLTRNPSSLQTEPYQNSAGSWDARGYSRVMLSTSATGRETLGYGGWVQGGVEPRADVFVAFPQPDPSGAGSGAALPERSYLRAASTLPVHRYEWSFSAEGAELFAVDRSQDGILSPYGERGALKVSLSAENREYSAQPYGGLTVVGAESFSTITGLELATRYVSSDGAGYDSAEPPTAAGAYTALMWPLGNPDAAARVDFKIEPKTVSVIPSSVKAKSKPHDGNVSAELEGAPLLEGVLGEDASQVAVGYRAAFADPAVGTLKDVAVNLFLTGGKAGNYRLASGSERLDRVADIYVTVPGLEGVSLPSLSAVYDGKPHVPQLLGELPAGVTVSYRYERLGPGGASTEVDSDDLRAAGSYRVIATFTGTHDSGGEPVRQSALVSIAPRPVSVDPESVKVVAKPFDGSTSAEIDLDVLALSGAIAGDEVAPLPLSAEFADPAVGADKLVRATFILTGADAGNYILDPVTVQAKGKIVDQGGEPLAAPAFQGPATVRYDRQAHGRTVAGLPDGITVREYAYERLVPADSEHPEPRYERVKAEDVVDVGTYRVTAILAANDPAASTPDPLVAPLVITPAPLSVSQLAALSREYDGTDGAALDISRLVLEGVLEGDRVTVDASGLLARFDDSRAEQDKPVRLTALPLTGDDAKNYAIDPVSLAEAVRNLSATILPLEVSVDIVFDGPQIIADGSKRTQWVLPVSVEVGGQRVTLVADRDFSIEGDTASEPGVHSIVLAGMGNFRFRTERSWRIAPSGSGTTGAAALRVGAGELAFKARATDGAPSTAVSTDGLALLDRHLSAEEAARVVEGAHARLILELTAGSDAEAHARIAAAASPGVPLLRFEATLTREFEPVGGGVIERTPIFEPAQPVGLRVSLPAEAGARLADGSHDASTLALWRDHAGAASSIAFAYEAGSRELAFESDRFSAFALTAHKVNRENPGGGDEGGNAKPGSGSERPAGGAGSSLDGSDPEEGSSSDSASGQAGTLETPDTGDSAPVLPAALALMAALVAAVGAKRLRARR